MEYLMNILFFVALFAGFPALIIFAVFRFGKWDKSWKIGISVVVAIIWVAAILMSMSQEAQLAAEGMRAAFSVL